MEDSALNSPNTPSDFEFKYIPKKEFERIVMKVREKRAWRNFCSVTSVEGDDDDEGKTRARGKESKAMSEEEVQMIVRGVDKEEVARMNKAPLFGPTRLLDVKTLRNQQNYTKTSSGSSSSSTSTIHIVEEVNVAQSIPTQQQKTSSIIQIPVKPHQAIIDNEEDESSGSSIDDNESLRSEMLKLCSEIENANGQASIEDSLNETGEKVIYSDIIDKEFDFLFSRDDEDATEVQTLPDVEPKRSDSSNDNNVWRPKMENQIRKSGRRERTEVKRDDDVFPSDVIMRKAREVSKLKRVVDEKPREDVEAKARKNREPTRDDVRLTLSRVTEYQSKICQYLDYLREIIEDPPEIDDVVDLQRRQKRATEFSNRFARNHLYQIGRVAEEIRIMHDNPLDIATRVNFLFQVIMQAVQIYLKNIEMFIYNSYPDKLLVLIDFVINALKICLDRMVFDKRDKLVQELLKRCSYLKQFLEENQFSLAKFAKIDEKSKKSLHSRNSFAYEVPVGGKLAMYDGPMMKPKKNIKMTQKSPYDAPKPRIVKSRGVASVSTRGHGARLKKSASNVSTMVQRVSNSGSDEAVKTVSEKPLEDTEVKKSQNQSEIFEMMQNIAKDKIQEMLAPLLSQLLGKSQSHGGGDEESEKIKEQPGPSHQKSEKSEKTVEVEASPRSSTSRVTSDIKNPSPKPRPPSAESKISNRPRTPKKVEQQNSEKFERVSNNVAYLYVNSNNDDKPSLSQQSSNTLITTAPQQTPSYSIPQPTKILSSKAKPPNPLQLSKLDSDLMRELKEQALSDRLHYVSQMMESPMYVNQRCSEPWKLLSRISDKILDEMLQSVIAELDFGEKSFVEKFIRSELRC